MTMVEIIADRGNAVLEALGGFFILISICKLHHDKRVRGISWVHVAFFAVWGWWNIYYYWAMGSNFSWWAGLGVTFANSAYLWMLIYYTKLEARYGDAYGAYLSDLADHYGVRRG